MPLALRSSNLVRAVRIVLLFLASGALCVSNASGQTDSANFETVTNLPPTVIDYFESIGSSTQVNVFDGGSLGGHFNAGNFGTTENIEVNIFGGDVGVTFDANRGSVINISGGSIGSAYNANRDSVTNISGGAIGTGFDANIDSVTNISGGAIGSDFEVKQGGTVNISGGVFGARFDARDGSIVNISGGSFGLGFSGRSGSSLDISGGTFGRFFELEQGSMATLHGGEFLLNGQFVSSSSPITVSGSEALAGTFSDGTPFAFSSINNDELSGVVLRATQLPTYDTGLIVVDGMTPAVPNGLRPGQSLELQGGSLDRYFAAVDATLNVFSGTVGNELKLANSVLTVDGGTIGDNAAAMQSSTVSLISGEIGSSFKVGRESELNVTGGTLGEFSSAFGGSSVTIAGGQVGRGFAAGASSEVAISGGRIGPNFEAAPGSEVSFIGADFKLNGQTIADLDAFSLPDGDNALTCVLADGSAVIFSQSSGDELNNVGLVLSDVPDYSTDPQTIVNSNAPVPASLRVGQFLTLLDTDVPNYFSSVGASVRVTRGAIGEGFEGADTIVILDDCEIGSRFSLHDGSRAYAADSSIGRYLRLGGGSSINLVDTTVDWYFTALPGSTVSVSGESSIGFAFNPTGSTVNVSGGNVNISAPGGVGFREATVNISGGTFGGDARVGDSDFTITGGNVRFEDGGGNEFDVKGGVLSLYGSSFFSRFDISGGDVELQNVRTTDIDLSGGTLAVAQADNANVWVRGGDLADGFRAGNGTECEISGGQIGDGFHAQPGSVVRLIGDQFLLDGEPLDLGLGESLVVEERDVELSGILQDGTPFSFNLSSVEQAGFDVFSPAATLQVSSLLPVLLGDINLDGVVNFSDIAPFIELLINGEYQREADINMSGAVDFSQIGPFIQLLISQ